MHHWLLFQKYTSIKHLVYIHLRNFLSVYTKDEEILWIKKGRLPLYQDTDDGKILYISSVGLQLSGCNSGKSQKVVNAIIAHLSANFGQIFNIKLVPPGWILVELPDPTLAAWLHFLTDRGLGLDGSRDTNLVENPQARVNNQAILAGTSWKGKNEHNLFTVQYTHARCCSLIRLANREGIIKLRTSSDEDESLTFDQSIPWLDCNQKLRLNCPEEMRLIELLVKMVDDLVFPNSTSSVNWITAAVKLSAAFESFYRSCRIWGEVKINALELAQARLGLLMVTQLVLKSVLETRLGVVAPMEL